MTALTFVRPSTPTYGTGKFGVSSLSATFAKATGAHTFLNAGGNPPGTGTFEAWVRTPTPGALQVFMSDPNWWVGVNGTGHLQCDKVSTTGNVTIGNGAWHHVALVFTAGSMALYCDGVKVSADVSAGNFGSASSVFNVGGLSEGADSFDFEGDIDEVRISTTARYSGSYTTPSAAFVSDGSTAELWHFDEGTPPAPTPVTATAPTKTDLSGTASDTYTIPVSTGVDYKVGGVTKAAGTYSTAGASSVVVTAVAQSGYSLGGTTSWTLTFSTASDPEPDPDPEVRFRLGFEPLVWTGTGYPARHPGAASVTYIGPAQPADWQPNDMWVQA